MSHTSPPGGADTSVFPDPVYAETVLTPLFDAVKRHHAAALGRINRAHLVMLAETGIVTPEAAAQIARALIDIDRKVDPETLTYTGEVEDFFFFVEKELKTRLGPDLAGRLHTARSRNDIDHTVFKLGLKQRLDGLLGQCRALLDALIDSAERHRETLVVAYTHGQPAQPTTFGHYLAAIIEVLIRDIGRLLEARRIVDLSPMGAAAITTSGFPIDRHRVAGLLGFAAPLQNSYSCIAAVDYVTATYGAIELLFLHLGRPIQDFQFWTAFEVTQLHVPNSLVQISSIMPQKRNPVPIEFLRLLSSQTMGRARAVLNVMHNTPFTDMNDSEGETQGFGYEAFASAARVLALLAEFIRVVRVDSRRVADNIDRSAICITELADSLVRRENLSFREGHEIASATARAVVAMSGRLAADGYAPFRAAFANAAGRETAITTAEFAELVSPAHFVAVRTRYGGPAPAPLGAAIAGYRETAAALARQAETAAASEAGAARRLDAAFAALAAG